MVGERGFDRFLRFVIMGALVSDIYASLCVVVKSEEMLTRRNRKLGG